MKPKNLLAGLVVVSLIGSISSRVMAQGYERSNVKQHHERRYFGSGSVIEEIQYRDLMKVGISMFEPWAMCNRDGDLIGYEVDVASKIAEDMRVRIQFVRTDWYYIIPALIEREFDVIISGMSITPARNLNVNFTSPYSEFGSSIVANTGQTEGLKTLEDFDSPDVTFAARLGTTPQEVITIQFPSAKLRIFDTGPEVLQALISGEVHAAAADQITATKWIEANPDTLHRPFDQLFNKLPEAIALRKGDVDGLNFFNSWITRHQVNGWLAERRQYWFGTRDWADQVATGAEVVRQCAESFTANPY